MDLRVPGPLSHLSVVTMRESFSAFHYEYLSFILRQALTRQIWVTLNSPSSSSDPECQVKGVHHTIPSEPIHLVGLLRAQVTEPGSRLPEPRLSP